MKSSVPPARQTDWESTINKWPGEVLTFSAGLRFASLTRYSRAGERALAEGIPPQQTLKLGGTLCPPQAGEILPQQGPRQEDLFALVGLRLSSPTE